MTSENNTWGEIHEADDSYGKSFDPTPEQLKRANEIIEGSELDGVTIEGVDDVQTSTNHSNVK